MIKISVITVFPLALMFLASCMPLHSNIEISAGSTEGSKSIVESDPARIPDYTGDDYIVLNNGKPCFNEWDLKNIVGEHYSELDSLGRCGCAYALLDRSMMPTGKREEIGHIKPSGWKQRRLLSVFPREMSRVKRSVWSSALKILTQMDSRRAQPIMLSGIGLKRSTATG